MSRRPGSESGVSRPEATRPPNRRAGANRRDAGGDAAPAPRKTRESAEKMDRHIEEILDEALEATFPASDPVSISRDR